MATFLYKTRGNSSSERKPRVFFTCHPDDFEKHFKKICEDIFKTHDCAIFYTEDLNEEIEEKYKESDLGQMNLFVIPITFKLLSQPNRAMDSDFRYAKEKHIPVLPIMMESGLDTLYSQEDKFGELQYLNPYTQDLTAISYEEKLKKYLESVLISDEMAERIRKAFDAYVFLSYRKKDRHYANELMKMIHSHPEFRDIAIWYDEFLTPGESFRENIERMMKDSKLFALLVTPSLLEYVDGKPNYVMAHEYPDAKKAGMDILPTEMEETDKDELHSKYDGIPDCIRPDEDEIFKKRLVDTLSKIAVSENNDDPEHNFLIGLAYLDGIDVEIDRERGLRFITFAAESELFEAMKKIYHIYNEGYGVKIDFSEAIKWGTRIVEYCKKNYGTKNEITIEYMHHLANTYKDIHDYEQSLKLNEEVYLFCCQFFGEENPNTISSLTSLGSSYDNVGKHQKALTLKIKAYELSCKLFDEEDLFTLTMLHNLAYTYSQLGEHEKALEYKEKVYGIRSKILGEKHIDTIVSINNLAQTYLNLKKHQEALIFSEKAYTLFCEVLGEDHPQTITALHNISNVYVSLNHYKKALELLEKVYIVRYEIFGGSHLITMDTWNDILVVCNIIIPDTDTVELISRLYEFLCKSNENNEDLFFAILSCVANMYNKLENFQKEAETGEKIYALRCRMKGAYHKDSLATLFKIILTYEKVGNLSKVLELQGKLYHTLRVLYGGRNQLTKKVLFQLAENYIKVANSMNRKDITNMNENTIIIWNPHDVTESVSDKLIEALISQGYTVKHFVPEISGSFDGLQVWEYQKMRNSFEFYIEKMISTNIEKGIFVPILHQDIHDKGWGEYLHRRIFSTLQRQTQATIFPLFVDYLYPDNEFQNAGITVRSQSIDVDISKAVKRITELCKKPI